MTARIETEDLTAETLLNLGFVDLAGWGMEGDHIAYALDGPHAEANTVRLDERNALYAFVRGDDVLYIGKTARTIRRRFLGYLRPGRGQPTNVRCNAKIREALGRSEEVRVFVFNPISHLRYGVFDVNLAAGLEDALIAAFDPPWNGRERGRPVTEEAEREEAEEAPSPALKTAETARKPTLRPDGPAFSIVLGTAYYRQGLINPGVEASRHLGRDGEPIEILFSDGNPSVVSRIDRTANRTGSVRVVGRNGEIARWFQAHFAPGETVEARILDAHRILLLAPAGDEAGEPKHLEGSGPA